MNFFWGVLYGTVAQILSFIQLQATIKFQWFEKYGWLILLLSIPNTLLYLKSVENFIAHFNGTLWESRFLGFSIGIIVFAVMSYLLFNEQMTPKVFLSIFLASVMIGIQIFMK